MKVTNPIPGGVAKSLICRDAGRMYLIVKAEVENVYLCDGKYSTLSNPKRKNKKHVRLMPVFFEAIGGRIGEGKDENSQIRAALRTVETGEGETNSSGGNVCPKTT